MKLVLVQPALRAAAGASNLHTIHDLVRGSGVALGADDLLLLPEHWSGADAPADYEHDVRELAATLGCQVVGGSHHERGARGAVNAGVACGADGRLLGRYEKIRPYAEEREQVQPGRCLGELTLAGRNILVLICADFWFADLILTATRLPDLLLVPALSVTRKATPDYSRALWRHLAVARAYEYGVYVGIRDWAADSSLPRLSAAGAGGFADPTETDPAVLFRPIGPAGVAVHELDFDRLEAFRHDRRQRGFFWKPR